MSLPSSRPQQHCWGLFFHQILIDFQIKKTVQGNELFC